MSSDRVEFLDAPAGDAGDDDLLDDDGSSGGPPRRWTLALVGVTVVVLLAALLVGRLVTGDDPARSTATATPSATVFARPSRAVTSPVFGVIGLPPAIGTPRELVAGTSGDVVWMLDRGAGIVRIENGTVTAVQLLESQVTAMAVSPDGARLYVATAADRPSVQELDGRSLTLGVSRPIEGSVSSLAVSTDAVWAASGSRLSRLDLSDLHPLATLDLPGVAVTDHLRMTDEQTAAVSPVLTGVVTGSIGNGPTTTRLLRVDPVSEQVAFGPDLPTGATVASAPLLTWVSGPATDPVTQGYATVLDTTPAATATPPLASGSRIYDGGGGFAAFLVVAPNSSVIGCRDPGGFPTSEVDIAPTLPGAVIAGQVLRTDTAFYAVTDRGLVRTGVGACT